MEHSQRLTLPSDKNKNNRTLHAIYLAGFIFTLHSAFIAYINSSFLNKIIGSNYVGIIFTAGALISIYSLSKISNILSRFGNFKTIVTISLLEILSLLGLAFIKSAWFIIPLFIIHIAFLSTLKFNFDVFVEHCSSNSRTGNIRGTFLTFLNLAWVVSPIIVGVIISNSDFWKVYLISALLLIPTLLIIYFNLKNIPDNHYDHPPFWKTLKEVKNNANIYKIFITGLILNFFFALMTIYMPIYLNQYIGFSWKEIGIIFTIMLIPFILLELPLGKLADWRFGEKEFLSIGFVIISITTGAIAFITSTNIIIWIIVMFLTRIGASILEIMTESYFFKQIDDTDINIISFFRNNRPIAYIAAPLFATIFLYYFDYQYLFLALGVIMLYGLRYSLTLKDTK